MFSITLSIIIITTLVSLAAFNNEKVKEDLLFWPTEIDRRKQYYRFFSYGLIHADVMHIVFNLFTLYSFGSQLELYTFSSYQFFGEKAKIFYLVLYLSAIVISPIPDYFRYRKSPWYRALGASGAVSAVVFSSIILQPTLKLSIIFIPFIPIPGYIFGLLFLAYSAYMVKRGGSNIGHSAHFTGALYGLLFTIIATKIYSGYDAFTEFMNVILNR